jgi:hypothetical protein
MVFEGLRKPCKGLEPSYTGACRHPQNLGFMSISKVRNPCFHVDRHGMSPSKKHWHTRTRTCTHTHTHTHTSIDVVLGKSHNALNNFESSSRFWGTLKNLQAVPGPPE